MWQRFDEMARKTIFYSQEEAQKFGEGYVSTEHLLLGLIRQPECLACRILEARGVSRNRVQVEVEKQLPRGKARPPEDMTLTPRAKRVLDLAFDEARILGNDHIGTEHLLLGLIREGNGIAGRALERLGVDLERAREDASALQNGESRPSGSSPSQREEFKPYPWSAYDDGAQNALYRAKGEADGMGETHLTPLHLLLALLEDETSGAVRTLREAGLDPERLRTEIERHRTWAEGAPGNLHLSPNGRKAMDAATIEAQALGSDRMRSEHILLGLAQGNPDGVGQILERLGVGAWKLRAAARRLEAAKEPPEA